MIKTAKDQIESLPEDEITLEHLKKTFYRLSNHAFTPEDTVLADAVLEKAFEIGSWSGKENMREAEYWESTATRSPGID